MAGVHHNGGGSDEGIEDGVGIDSNVVNFRIDAYILTVYRVLVKDRGGGRQNGNLGHIAAEALVQALMAIADAEHRLAGRNRRLYDIIVADGTVVGIAVRGLGISAGRTRGDDGIHLRNEGLGLLFSPSIPSETDYLGAAVTKTLGIIRDSCRAHPAPADADLYGIVCRRGAGSNR